MFEIVFISKEIQLYVLVYLQDQVIFSVWISRMRWYLDMNFCPHFCCYILPIVPSRYHQMLINSDNLQRILNWSIYLIYQSRLFVFHQAHLGISPLLVLMLLSYCLVCFHRVSALVIMTSNPELGSLPDRTSVTCLQKCVCTFPAVINLPSSEEMDNFRTCVGSLDELSKWKLY